VEPEELSCKALVEVVTDYLEQALPGPERVRFEAHLAECEGCRTYLDQMRKTIGALGALTEEAIPAEERERLLELFRGWQR
jgi:predicted anti-sigma-YlaC factor YlaD